MRPTVRRIDLTQTPTTVEVWPSLDWLEPTAATAPRPPVFGASPRRRTGLWDAMASAVQRARESSLGDAGPTGDDRPDPCGDVIEMTHATPHLAYLARVACGDPTRRNDVPGADVIAFVDAFGPEAG
jgi:hypothetical protein